jgi:hypothetical protein
MIRKKTLCPGLRTPGGTVKLGWEKNALRKNWLLEAVRIRTS